MPFQRKPCACLCVGSNNKSKVALTDCALNGSPLWNFTPLRSSNSHVVSSIAFQEVARAGAILSFSSRVSNGSNIKGRTMAIVVLMVVAIGSKVKLPSCPEIVSVPFGTSAAPLCDVPTKNIIRKQITKNNKFFLPLFITFFLLI